jgi:hypothetical protein
MASFGGKGSSSAETTQQTTNNVKNEQVAAQSGIAVGANSSAEINVTTADPEVAKAALLSNAATSNSALNFAGHAADSALSVANDVSKTAITQTADTANLAIIGNTKLASEYASHVSEDQARNIGLLQDLANQNVNTTLANNKLTEKALDASFTQASNAAPQSEGATAKILTDTAFKYIIIIVGIIAVLFGVLTYSKRK